MSKKQNRPLNIIDFTLLADNVMIEPISAASVQGLVKPDTYDDKPEFGLVVKVGNGKMVENGTVVPLQMKPGDHVYFGKYSSIKVRSDGKDYLIIRDYDIMAVKPCE